MFWWHQFSGVVLAASISSLLCNAQSSSSEFPGRPFGNSTCDSIPCFRYYNKQTAPYLIEQWPDVRFNTGEFYSGLIPIDESNPERNLFFIFKPAMDAPTNDITIWLNGGPGCSSLTGFFQENGYEIPYVCPRYLLTLPLFPLDQSCGNPELVTRRRIFTRGPELQTCFGCKCTQMPL